MIAKMRLSVMVGWLGLSGGAALLAGCSAQVATPVSDYRTLDAEPHRDLETAVQCNENALCLLDKGDLDGAQRQAKAALDADVGFGPGHNTLGMVYFRQSQLYLAAWEFQYAIKLMPERGAAQNNLGLVYEAAGKLDQAETAYTSALALENDNGQFRGNLVRVRLRRGERDEVSHDLLAKVAMQDDRPEWAQWARQQLILWRTPTTYPSN